LDEEGLYRVPGAYAKYLEWKRLLERGVCPDYEQEKLPENICQIIIKYLKALPEPIYTARLRAVFEALLGEITQFISLSHSQGKPNDEAQKLARRAFYHMPLPNRESIRAFGDHLCKVVNNEKNKMPLKNIKVHQLLLSISHYFRLLLGYHSVRQCHVFLNFSFSIPI